jgi:hypothetical protein
MKYFGWLLAALAAIAIVIVLVAAYVNRRDAEPSADYLRLMGLIRDRPAVDDEHNAFTYVLGIRAPAGLDPQEAGTLRADWLRLLDDDIGLLEDDPLEDRVEFSDLRSEPVELFLDACDSDAPHDCEATFDVLPGPESWSDADRLLLERYRAMIQRGAWREHVGNDVSQPLPSFADMTVGQRLSMLALRGADAATLRDALSRDLDFWRMMLASSDTLLAKMIAVAGLRQHFQYGNLLMRRVAPADRAGVIPAGWRAELTRAELRLEGVYGGEQVQMQKLWRSTEWVYGEETPRYIPFFQPQDSQNEVAADYVELVAAFDVPLAEFPRVAEMLSKKPQRHPFGSRLFNLGGDYLGSLGKADYSGYPLRVATVEAWRRAALLTAELRARGVPLTGMTAELAKAQLQSPFRETPFSWSEPEKAVVYQGIEDQGANRRRQVYPY